MSNYYQPLIIQVLLENNGRATAEELAQQILLYNDEELERARVRLNVHPWATLGNTKGHGVVRREGRGRKSIWILEATYDPQEIDNLIELCRRKIQDWCKKNPSISASLRYQLIQEAEGRCQACGVVSQAEHLHVNLHVDHIVPQIKAQNGKVKTSGGNRIDVNSKDNLQVLCKTCNTGKREHGDFDFRPSPQRLQDALDSTLNLAQKYGYDVHFSNPNFIIKYASQYSATVPDPTHPSESLPEAAVADSVDTTADSHSA